METATLPDNAATRAQLRLMLEERHTTGSLEVRHMSHMLTGTGRSVGRHHELHHWVEPERRVGMWHCAVCPRVVIRGMGRWWE